jgi:hypothetical protein
MGVTYNPQIVTDGLVVYYDMSNTQKSWKGAPTVNLVTLPNSVVIYSTGATLFLNVIELPVEVAKTSPLTDKGDLFVATSGSGVVAHTATTVTSGLQYMISWYVKAYGTESSVFWNWGGSHSGNRTTFNVSLLTGAISGVTLISGESYNVTSAGDGWWRISCSTTVSSTACYPQLSFSVGIYLAGIQFEQKNYLSAFSYGTRSNTRSLLDLTNNTVFDVGNLTYSSNNTFSFNGTNYIRPAISHSYKNSSALEVTFKPTSVTGQFVVFGYLHNNGYSNPTIGSIYINNGTLSASVITATQVYRVVTSSVAMQNNTTYNVILNKDTVAGTLALFVNGVSTGTQTFDAWGKPNDSDSD